MEKNKSIHNKKYKDENEITFQQLQYESKHQEKQIEENYFNLNEMVYFYPNIEE